MRLVERLLFVADLVEAKSFYLERLGLEVQTEAHDPVRIELDGTVLCAFLRQE